MDTLQQSQEDLRTCITAWRKVSYARYGQPGGTPVIFCHGFPGSRLQAHYLDSAARARDLLVLAPDRPGIGASTSRPLESIAEWADDASAFIDSLGLDRVALFGVSGGGPFALALAARLGARALGAVVLASPCELNADVLRHSRLLESATLRLARLSPALVRITIRHTMATKRRGRLGLLRLRLHPVDRQMIASANIAASLDANRSQAVVLGSEALERESVLYTLPWGFDLADVACRVDVWVGSKDQLTPPFMAEHLVSQLADAELHIVPGEGHFTLLHSVVAEALDALTQRFEAP